LGRKQPVVRLLDLIACAAFLAACFARPWELAMALFGVGVLCVITVATEALLLALPTDDPWNLPEPPGALRPHGHRHTVRGEEAARRAAVALRPVGQARGV
jgi:hypothetical protein